MAGLGVEVTAGKVDVETIRKASEFVAHYDGKLEDAIKAVSTVDGFVEACGGAEIKGNDGEKWSLLGILTHDSNTRRDLRLLVHQN